MQISRTVDWIVVPKWGTENSNHNGEYFT
uniref:Uncharacterized protein n=1 Tax=Strigamia maritima TaxID=126957 RepID=T1JKZ0_STRMM